jgi:SAM-dependent methyltransferase
VEGYDASTYGDRFADVYDDWYADLTDGDACVDRVAALVAESGAGPVLELGVGSGRLAVPLARRGIEVHGVDASTAMLDRLRARDGGDAVTVHLGDMADLDLQGTPGFSVVLAAFNTLFNVASEDGQRRCLARAAAHLSRGGRLVVEAFVPDDTGEGQGAVRAVEPRSISIDEVVLTVSRVDRGAQTVTGQHVQLTERGIRLRPWHLRWATPAQLDEMAVAAGLALEWRAGGWSGEPFDDRSTTQVACYRKP